MTKQTTSRHPITGHHNITDQRIHAIKILLPNTVEQRLTIFDFYLAQQNQVTYNRIRQVTGPGVGLCISDGT